MIEAILTPSLPSPRGGARTESEPATATLFADLLAGFSMRAEVSPLATLPSGSAVAADGGASPVLPPAVPHVLEPGGEPLTDLPLQPGVTGSRAGLADLTQPWPQAATLAPAPLPAPFPLEESPVMLPPRPPSADDGRMLWPQRPTAADAITQRPPLASHALVSDRAAALTGDRPLATAYGTSASTSAAVQDSESPHLANVTLAARPDVLEASPGARPEGATTDLSPQLRRVLRSAADSAGLLESAEAVAYPPDGQTGEREAAILSREGAGAPRPVATAPRPGVIPLTPTTVAVRELPALALHAFADGRQMLVVALEPAALGRVQVAFEFARDGRISLRLRAEKAEALERLQREAVSFVRIFGAHGIDLQMASVSFELSDQNGEQANAFRRRDEHHVEDEERAKSGTAFSAVLKHLFDLRT